MVTVAHSLVALVFVASSSLALALPAAPSDSEMETGSIHADFSSSLAACATADCRLDAAEAFSDDVASRWGALPTGSEGIAAVVRQALADSGYLLAPPKETRSTDLASALLRLYDVSDVDADASVVRREAASVKPSLAAALTPLVDAVADAQVASRAILAPDDIALLAGDLRETMLLGTFRDLNAETSAMWAERAVALDRVDRGALAAASIRLGDAMSAVPPIATAAAACDPVLALPFVVVGGPCDDVYADDLILAIDAGGNDRYLGRIGTGLVGIGAGLSIDQGDGDDEYNSTLAFNQGFGLAGAGILFDEGGADHYNLAGFGQGFSVAGLGLLYDAGVADDVYDSPTVVNVTIGTKAGSLAGVGLLVDEGGNDFYHQDGLDGFVYGATAGSGLLLERGGGHDRYVSNDMPIWLLGTFVGTFTGPVQVSAEAVGVAILYEEGGDDSYVCGQHVRQGCQGAGGVGGLAAILERSGSDDYWMGNSISPTSFGLVTFPMGQGAGYGIAIPVPVPPGPGVGALLDDAGDDSYTAGSWAQGFGSGGIGLLSDGGGLDSYSLGAGLLGSRGNGQTWADGAAGAGRDV